MTAVSAKLGVNLRRASAHQWQDFQAALEQGTAGSRCLASSWSALMLAGGNYEYGSLQYSSRYNQTEKENPPKPHQTVVLVYLVLVLDTHTLACYTAPQVGSQGSARQLLSWQIGGGMNRTVIVVVLIFLGVSLALAQLPTGHNSWASEGFERSGCWGKAPQSDRAKYRYTSQTQGRQ